MKIIKKSFFSLLVIFIFMVSLGHENSYGAIESQNSVHQLSIQQLKDFLLSKVPSFQGANDFFDSEAVNIDYSTLIQSDRSLIESANRGQAFRNQYFKQMESVFGVKNLLIFKDYKMGLFEWIQAVRSIEVFEEVEISEEKAIKLAWTETLENFNLPRDSSFSDIQRDSIFNINLLGALDYYKRRKNILSQSFETHWVIKDAPIVAVNDQVSKRIKDLRLLNFVSAFKVASERKNRDLILIDSESKHIKINLDDLAKGQFSFLPKNSIGSLYSYLSITKNKSLTDSLINSISLIPSKSDTNAVSETYMRRRLNYYSSGRLRIQLGNKNQRVIDISEDELRRIIFDLEGLFPKDRESDPILYRFLIEASNRDRLLIEIQDKFLKISSKLKTKSELLEKFQTQNNLIRNNFFYPWFLNDLSLTGKIAKSNEILKSESQNEISNIKWAGYAINPSYWETRDQSAKALRRPHFKNYLDQKKSSQTISQKLNQLKLESKEQFYSRFRLWSNKLRAAVFATGISASLLLPGTLGINTLNQWITQSTTVESAKDIQVNDDQVKNREVKPFPKDAKGKDFVGAIKIGDTDSSSNAPWSDTEGNLIFKIISGKVEAQNVPYYLNLPQNSNFPKDIQTTPDGKDQSSNLLKFSSSNTSKLSDFYIESQVPTSSLDGRIPIAVPSDSKIDNLQIYNAKTQEYINPNNIDIYTIKQNGLSYIKITQPQPEGSVYFYRAGYVKFNHQTIDPDFEKYNAQKLSEISEKLRSVGQSQLADAILDMGIVEGKMNVSQFANSFASTGVYTYDPETGQSDNSHQFGYFSKFLRDGVLYYMCNGAARLMNEILNEYYGNDSTVEVQTVIGFLHSGGEIVSAPGHLHNIITKKNGDFVYTELDGVPNNMDPKYKNKSKIPRTQVFKDDLDWRVLEKLEQASSYKKMSIRNDEQPVKRPKPSNFTRQEFAILNDNKLDPKKVDLKKNNKGDSDTEEPPSREGGTSDFEQSNFLLDTNFEDEKTVLHRNVTQLHHLKVNTFQTIEAQLWQFPQFQNLSTAAFLPGLRSLAVARIILEYAEGRSSVHQTLEKLLALKYNNRSFTNLNQTHKDALNPLIQELTLKEGSAENAIEFLLKENLLELEQKIRVEKKNQEEGRTLNYSYLLDQIIQNSTLNLSELLTKHSWSISTEKTTIQQCQSLF